GLTAATLVNQTMLGPLTVASLRFFTPAREANQMRAYFAGVLRLLVQATFVLLSLAGLLGIGLWLSGNDKWLGLALMALAFALFTGYNSTLDGMQNAARQRVIVAWHDGLAVWLRFFGALALVSILGTYSQVAMLGYVLAAIVVLSSQFFFFRQRIIRLSAVDPETTPSAISLWAKKMVSYGWPFAVWGIFTWVRVVSDRWALQIFASTYEVGLYAVLYQLGYYPISVLSGMLSQVVLPIFYAKAGSGTEPARLLQVYRLNVLLIVATVCLTLSLGTVAFFFHKWIFDLFVAPEYHIASRWLPWMVLSGGLLAAAEFAAIALLSGMHTQKLIVPKVVTALIGMLLNLAGAWWFGLAGIVLAGLVFSCVYFAWVMLLIWKTLPHPRP
ncbi:MAG: hypothetical protein Q7U74_13025, partial [Saprospiraceae bacterium]|nr:hypothetical protein [Saprospiraceae bacterium]